MRATWAIARMQLLAIRRRKLLVFPVLVALLLGLLFLPLFDIGSSTEVFAKESLLRVIEGIVFSAGTFVGILIGAGAVAGEVESGAVLIVAVRPIQRWQLFLGKLLGVTIAMLAIFLVWDLVIASAFAFHFDAAKGDPTIFRFTFVDVLFSFPATLLMTTIATTLGAFLRTLPAAALSLVMWGATWLFHAVAGETVRDLAGKNASGGLRSSTSIAIHLARGYDWAVPRHRLTSIPQQLQGKDAIHSGAWTITSEQVVALLVLVAWAVLGALLFQQRESLSTSAE